PSVTFLVQWLVTWIMLAVVFFVAADAIQRYLYEAAVEKLGWRVMAVTPILAAVLVKWPLPFESMFFNLSGLILQGILWFVACCVGLRFQWQRAAAAGLIAIATIAPIVSSSVESLTKRMVGGTSTSTPATRINAETRSRSDVTAPAETSAPGTLKTPTQK